MTEMITIIAVGVGLAGLILNGQKNAREELRDFKVQVNERLDKMDVRFERLEVRMGTMERQQAKIVGAVPLCPPVWFAGGIARSHIGPGTRQSLVDVRSNAHGDHLSRV